MFKVAMQDRRLVLLTTPENIEEIRKVPEDRIDFIHAAMDASNHFDTFSLRTSTHNCIPTPQTLEARHTFSPETYDDPIVVGIVQSHLTKHLDFSFDEAHDEVGAAFSDKLGHIDNGEGHTVSRCILFIENELTPQTGLPSIYCPSHNMWCLVPAIAYLLGSPLVS